MERKEARARGIKQYDTGNRCRAGHFSPRWTSTGGCVECGKARYEEWRKSGAHAAWRTENNEHILAQQANYRNLNRLRRAEAARVYYAEHADERGAYQRKYLVENRAAVYARLHKRRARKRCATPPWYGELDDLVMLEGAALCALRRHMTGIEWQLDHMVPLSARNACGLHCAANMQVIPRTLNARKSNRMWLIRPLEWLRALS